MTNDSLILLSKALESAHRFELKELDLSENDLDNESAKALIIMIQRFTNICSLNLKGN